jgi:hypothetical protein
MSRLRDTVTAYLDKRAWSYEPRGRFIVSPVASDAGSWTMYFELREDDEQLVVYSLIPARVPPDRRTSVAVFLTRANYGLAIGNFELDLDDGEVRYKTSVDVEGTSLDEPLVDHLLLANIVTVGRYLSALESVIAGSDPIAAADRADALS